MPQLSDYRIAVITGTTAGVTGGEIVPPENEMVIHDISYADVSATGNLVSVIAQPGGQVLDAKNVAASSNTIYGEPDMRTMHGNVPRNNVMQVTTTRGSVIVKVVYTIEYQRFV